MWPVSDWSLHMTVFLLVDRQRWEKEVGRAEAVYLEFSFIMFSQLFAISVVLQTSFMVVLFPLLPHHLPFWISLDHLHDISG